MYARLVEYKLLISIQAADSVCKTVHLSGNVFHAGSHLIMENSQTDDMFFLVVSFNLVWIADDVNAIEFDHHWFKNLLDSLAVIWT